VLFLQGKDDERCPKCQSEELFVSLMRAGDTPTELVLYPGADHHFLGRARPRAGVMRRRASSTGLRRWVLPTTMAGPAGPHAACRTRPTRGDSPRDGCNKRP
jgi:fermentation-respiration switch protein FrsA (DUF1100 family)